MANRKYSKGLYLRGKIFWIRYAGLDGKMVFESSRSSKVRDAESLIHKRKADIAEGKQPETKKIVNYTFGELCEEYLKWAERQRSYKSKRGFVAQLKERFGNLPLRRFNTMLIEKYQTDRSKQGKKHGSLEGNKPATINRHVATIKHMFTKAVDWEMVEEEVLKKIKKAKLLEENNRRLRYLCKEECQSLVKNATDHLKPIIIMALNTGMRKDEILSLKWEHIDLKNGFILLQQTKNGERREIPINSGLKESLRGIVQRLDVPYIFFDKKSGKRYKDIKTAFNSACRRAGIGDFHFHDLRHTFASQLVMAGIDLTSVRELLGHKTLTMTLRYAHLAPSHKKNAVDILDGIINEKSTAQKLYKNKEATNA